ncbi:hypothetical protein ACLOJK_030554 [Asimina triloba]
MTIGHLTIRNVPRLPPELRVRPVAKEGGSKHARLCGSAWACGYSTSIEMEGR